MSRYIVASVLIAGLLALALVSMRGREGSKPEAEPHVSLSSVARASAIASSLPKATAAEVDRLLHADDRLHEKLGADSSRDWVAERLSAVIVTDAERRAWYASHRELFGQRSYEQSVGVLDRWLRLRKVQTELEQQ